MADWVRWISGDGTKPENIHLMADQPAEHTDSGVAFSSRVAHGIGEVSEAALALARGAADAVVAANRSVRTLAVETVRTLPRLARLGQLNDHTRISLAASSTNRHTMPRRVNSCCSTGACTPMRR